MPTDRGEVSAAGVQKPPRLLEAAAVVLLIVNTALDGLRYARSVPSVAALVGVILAPTLFMLLLVGVVRLFKGARTRRGVAQLAVVTLSLVLTGKCGSMSREARSTISDDKLQALRIATVAKVVAEVGKTLPRRIDDETELFRVSSDGAVLVYSYRLLNMAGSEVDPETLTPALIQRVCGEPKTRDDILKQGIGFRYVYYDKNGAIVVTVPVSINDCRNLGAASGGR